MALTCNPFDSQGGINSYIVGCKYSDFMRVCAVSVWINSYIVGCKCCCEKTGKIHIYELIVT